MDGYPVRLQRVQRTGTCSYYVNFPAALAQALQAQKAEQWLWLLEDKNTLLLKRLKPLPARKPKSSASA